MAKLPVSVCIIAKNEEKYIEQCLRHLLPFGMEIVVVDTGSTDRTKEIALKYTDKVYDFVWTNNFSAARNFAASKAKNNWILVVDCDEYVKELDIQAVRMCMQKHAHQVGMMKIKNLHTQSNGEQTYHIDEVPRLYNRNFYEYRFRIHEQITPKDAALDDKVVLYTFKMPVMVEHHGYDLPEEEMLQKQERNLELLQSALGENAYDDYLYFQIAQSNYILHRYEEAAVAMERCFSMNPDIRKGYMKVAIPAYARIMRKVNRSEDALKHLLQYQEYANTAECSYLLGCCYQECGENLKALLTLVKVTQMADIDMLGEEAYDVYVRIVILHNLSGNQEGVIFFKQRLVEYGLSHGRKIVFE
ncbi:MAG: glycosyltransferase family 2 protein [Lachnospiraceae bacterium]|nr:glycosyltransferase family 2 protein [Lachnospiraceae bacterium]